MSPKAIDRVFSALTAPEMTSKEIANATGLATSTVQFELANLQRYGLADYTKINSLRLWTKVPCANVPPSMLKEIGATCGSMVTLASVLSAIQQNPGADVNLIAEKCNLRTSTIRNILTRFHKENLVFRSRTHNGAYAYWVDQEPTPISIAPAPEVKPAPVPAPENCAPPAPAPKITPTPEPAPPPSKEQKSQLSLFNIGAETESFSAQKEALKHLADAAKLNNSYAIQALKEIALGKA